MRIKVRKTIEEDVEINITFPCYFKNVCHYYYIPDESVTEVCTVLFDEFGQRSLKLTPINVVLLEYADKRSESITNEIFSKVFSNVHKLLKIFPEVTE